MGHLGSTLGLPLAPLCQNLTSVTSQGLVKPIDAGYSLNQDCSAFKTAGSHPIGSKFKNVLTGGDDFLTYLRFVQGGYTRAEFEQYSQTNLASVSSVVEQCVGSVKKSLYGSNTTDKSYPRCSSRQRWAVGDYGGRYVCASSFPRCARD